MRKIVTIGEIVVELMADKIGQSFREPGVIVGPFASGAPAIFIDQVAKLGQPCGMISCVGDDDFGWLNINRLKADGVDTSGIAIDPEYPTGSAFVRYHESGARDFIFNIKHSACSRTAMTDAGRALLASADHLHVMGSSLFSPGIVAVVEEALTAIKAKGGTVSFDPNIRKEILTQPAMKTALRTMLAQSDIFLPSGGEVTLLTDAADEASAIQAILDLGVSQIVIKRGSEGATFVDATRSVNVPAFVVEEIDPTGAGDCFGATYVTCWLRGMTPEQALRTAAAAGARAVTVKGPMEGVSSFADLEPFLAVAGEVA